MIEKNLAGPLGVVVKASTLRDYGVDNFFFLENGNTDTTQRNVVFIARGEGARHAQMIAGTACPFRCHAPQIRCDVALLSPPRPASPIHPARTQAEILAGSARLLEHD